MHRSATEDGEPAMQLSGLLARLTPDERATLLERRLGPNAVALDDRALFDQLAQPHAVGAALARLNSAQLLLLRWLSTRPGLQATWPELLEAIGDRLTSELLTAYLHDLKLWGLVDYDPRPKDGFFVTYPAVATRLPARRGVHLGPTLSELSNEILLKVCAQLGVGNALTRKAARSQLVASALADTSRCRAVVEGLPGPARSLFDWIRDQGGFV